MRSLESSVVSASRPVVVVQMSLTRIYDKLRHNLHVVPHAGFCNPRKHILLIRSLQSIIRSCRWGGRFPCGRRFGTITWRSGSHHMFIFIPLRLCSLVCFGSRRRPVYAYTRTLSPVGGDALASAFLTVRQGLVGICFRLGANGYSPPSGMANGSKNRGYLRNIRNHVIILEATGNLLIFTAENSSACERGSHSTVKLTMPW